MRTPTAMIVGIVLGPCGLVLNLTSTLAPNWRDVKQIPRRPSDLVQHQGIWDICEETESTRQTQCNIGDSLEYFSQLPVQVAKGLMPASLATLILGLVVASLGVRCWTDTPHSLLAGLGGLLLFASGLLSLIAVSWYNHELYNLPAITDSTLQVGYCLVLGYLGSCLEIIGGISLTASFHRCCKERKLKKAATSYSYPPANKQVPAITMATASSVDSKDLEMHYRTPTPRSYTNSLDVLEDERASTHSYRSRLPCDSDL
ncbi:claudin-23 [Eublepharis macularius]|uniref:Claudin-23 n=1 Tax=Eublepharis macularius TaxID=481883 RepID=A0AA97JRT8_EUBMA|nr:claudin-23 [Eublepharis macularius]XP_054843031.1 claudin-23 [Eublepharis macularius]XP_054843033.1 claudin-23 [Eublepharis macularius]